MTTVDKIFETLAADLNQENSRIIAVFKKITVASFYRGCLIGISFVFLLFLKW